LAVSCVGKLESATWFATPNHVAFVSTDSMGTEIKEIGACDSSGLMVTSFFIVAHPDTPFNALRFKHLIDHF